MKTIIKKEVTESGTIKLLFFRGGDDSVETIHFDNEEQLKAFSFDLSFMLEMNADSIEVE